MIGILSVLRKPLKAIDERIGMETFKLGVVLATVYFVQGMGGLSNIPLLFYFKDVLHFNEAQTQYFTAITGIAWLVKPLFGFISDRWPLFGYRRKSYMVLMAGTAALSWWMLAILTYFGITDYIALVLIFNLSSLGYAFVDVVCDAIMVERGQAEKMETAFVNIQWFALGVAGAVASFSGGYLQEMIKTGGLSLHWVFVITGFIPFLTGIVAIIFINEKKRGGQESEQATIGWTEIKEILSIKTFWVLTAFIFFWKYSPSFGSVFDYYRIDILKFDPQFLGSLAAIGKAIFPLSIVLYVGLLRHFPRIGAEHYLYGSIIIGIAYYAANWLFLVPETTFNRMCFNLPSARFILIISGLALGIALLLRERARFVMSWLIIIPASFAAAITFTGLDTNPFALSYRSLSVITEVLFSYATIASFIIPLALAAELAPKKAEGMTYAYFMALSNISAGFLPDISGAWMFEVLKGMLQHPETTLTWTSLHWYNCGVYLIQQSYSLLSPVIGQADFLGDQAYRALILRYALIIGALFTLISTPFVYLLPKASAGEK